MLTEKEIRANRKSFTETDRQLATMFRALGDVSRFRIIRILTAEPEVSVTTIAKILHLSTSLTSQNIKVLEHAHLLKKRRAGKKVFSKLDRGKPHVEELVPCVAKLIDAFHTSLQPQKQAALPRSPLRRAKRLSFESFP